MDADLDTRVEVGGQDYIALTYSVPEAMQGGGGVPCPAVSPRRIRTGSTSPDWCPSRNRCRTGGSSSRFGSCGSSPPSCMVIYRLAITQ
ncbi:MAG: hypothetical protein R3F11_25000 [Verrucomicrobiales bacterium]